MFGRFLGLAAGIAAVSVFIGGIAGTMVDPAKDAPAAAAVKADNAAAVPEVVDSRFSGSGEVRLGRAPDSHFYADVTIDGTTTRMMVDSGASLVALTRADAELLGIDVDALEIGGSASTAGGTVPLRPVRLDRVEVDGLEVRGVDAAVIDADMPFSLLGQSYLSKLGGVTVEGDTMTLH